MQIDELVVLEQSEDVSPVRAVEPGIYAFDLAKLEPVDSGTFNELFLSYWTTASCDYDVFVFNNRTRLWDQIGFEPSSPFCFDVPTLHGHLFSSNGLGAEDYVNDDYELLIQSGDIFPQGAFLRALVLNPDYYAIPQKSIGYGIAADGRTLLVASYRQNALRRISFSGEVIAEYEAPGDLTLGLAYDGECFWLSDVNHRVYKLDQSAIPICDFSVPEVPTGAIAMVGDRLWLAERQGGGERLFVIDPVASCACDTAVVDTVIRAPGPAVEGLAFDGVRLLVVDHSAGLVEMSLDGDVIEIYEHRIYFPTDLAWDGSAFWLQNAGTVDLMTYEPVIARFRLPPTP
jgi:hypothetical protein